VKGYTPFPVRSYATNIHPDTGMGLCMYACRDNIIRAHVEGKNDKLEQLHMYFGFKQNLFLRAEHVFYFELVKAPRLTELRHGTRLCLRRPLTRVRA
jgi:hypothetical protein